MANLSLVGQAVRGDPQGLHQSQDAIAGGELLRVHPALFMRLVLPALGCRGHVAAIQVVQTLRIVFWVRSWSQFPQTK